jgi:hypothetical protein
MKYINQNKMSKQKTAVEWFSEMIVDMIHESHHSELADLYKSAIEMEKEQIMDAFGVGCQVESTRLIGYQGMAEQYYNETYESNGSDDHLPDVREMVEISDEEIIKLANEYILYNDSKRQWVIEGMKLYREQLKKK